jgi:CheY-like chemotaxis protein
MAKKILVADDSVVIQKSIGITFAQEDFEVTFVGNGEEAFSKAKDLQPDMILADTSMPKISGGDLCKKFRQDTQFTKTPILLLASTQETFNTGQLQSLGANDFIQKPFESTQLLEKVKNLFANPMSFQSPAAAMPAPSNMEKSIDDVFGSQPGNDETLGMYAPTNPGASISDFSTPDLTPSPIELAPEPSSAEFEIETSGGTDFLKDIHSEETKISYAPNKPAMDISNLGDDQDDFPSVASFKLEPEARTMAATPQPTKPQAAPATPAQTTSAPSSASLADLKLSEQQIEQIVSKVFQGVIERIAWEVVPEMAERIIREEIEKITSDK